MRRVTSETSSPGLPLPNPQVGTYVLTSDEKDEQLLGFLAFTGQTSFSREGNNARMGQAARAPLGAPSFVRTTYIDPNKLTSSSLVSQVNAPMFGSYC
jgi:hypothetical protein